MRKTISNTFAAFLFIGLAFSLTANAQLRGYQQILVEDGATVPVETEPAQSTATSATPQPPRTGKAAATDYFRQREKKEQKQTFERAPSSSERVLMIHLGTFLNDKAHRWGNKLRDEDVGTAQLGVSYRVGEWTNSMDLFFRAEFMSYDIDNDRPLKLSVMPIVAFPDARSAFPIYFGAGAGLGVFFEQAEDESDLSIDYALIVGARFPDLFEYGGLFFETGLKGHVHLLSSGQQDGVFISAGALFNF